MEIWSVAYFLKIMKLFINMKILKNMKFHICSYLSGYGLGFGFSDKALWPDLQEEQNILGFVRMVLQHGFGNGSEHGSENGSDNCSESGATIVQSEATRMAIGNNNQRKRSRPICRHFIAHRCVTVCLQGLSSLSWQIEVMLHSEAFQWPWSPCPSGCFKLLEQWMHTDRANFLQKHSDSDSSSNRSSRRRWHSSSSKPSRWANNRRWLFTTGGPAGGPTTESHRRGSCHQESKRFYHRR